MPENLFNSHDKQTNEEKQDDFKAESQRLGFSRCPARTRHQGIPSSSFAVRRILEHAGKLLDEEWERFLSVRYFDVVIFQNGLRKKHFWVESFLEKYF